MQIIFGPVLTAIDRRCSTQWHKWYAWYPVISGDYWSGGRTRIIWLEDVYRRRDAQFGTYSYRNTRYPEEGK